MKYKSLSRLGGGAMTLAAGLIASMACQLPAFANTADDDEVVLSFSTVGDSRQDPANPDPTTAPLSGQDAMWLQNTRAWSRIINSVEQQKSNFLFFNGDMIMGYGWAKAPADISVATVVQSDLMKFYKQYGYWRGMVAGMMENGTYVVPVPGNHEVQCKSCGKKAQVENENAWRDNMGDLILDDNRLMSMFGETPSYEDIAGPQNFATDQKQLTYSFDFRNSHFVIINTDAVGNDGHAPTQWLQTDMADAQARGMQHFFVFGHKPAYTYYYGVDVAGSVPLPGKPAGLDADLPSRDAFWDVIEQYDATYFCGHEHIYNTMQPRAATGGKSLQVLVGSGGSPFEAAPEDATINPATDRTYAWASVKVYKNGKIKLKVYGFDNNFGQTRLIDSFTLNK